MAEVGPAHSSQGDSWVVCMGEAYVGVETPPSPNKGSDEKGKAIAEAIIHPQGTGGEGTSGIKEGAIHEGASRKPGQCLPKSKAVPKL